MLASARPLAACPFCTALKPSLAQQREQAAAVALGEVEAIGGDKRSSVRVHRVLKGDKRIGKSDTLTLELDIAVKPGALLILFGSPADAPSAGQLAWRAVGVDETSYAYFARAPSLKTTAIERLRYFAPFLEHADPLVAEDAYLEFGHAPFDQIARMADLLPAAKMRAWLVDPRVPQARKGFYGLAIALNAAVAEKPATTEFLRHLVLAPENDFRGGFDGVLGGYLLLAGPEGLALIESRYLANPRAADGDVRHALTALRFYYEYGHDIPTARLSQALAKLLARDEFAEAAITDLARWKAWDVLDEVVAVYARPDIGPAARRAVVGYLLACPSANAEKALASLRALDPQGVKAAEEVLAKTSSVPAE